MSLSSRRRQLIPVAAAALLLSSFGTGSQVFASPPAGSSATAQNPDEPIWRPGTAAPRQNEAAEEALLERDIAFARRRTAGDKPLSWRRAGELRWNASVEASTDRRTRARAATTSNPTTFGGTWANAGPSPINELTRSTPIFEAMNGRIGALAIRADGTYVLGGAQGGIWTLAPGATSWVARTDNLASLAIGAVAVAKSDDQVVYAGTGEGALSGDSYTGNGVLRSTDGGQTWAHVSGDYFRAVSISHLVIDPTDADHLYVSVLTGRGGNRRVSPTAHSRFGIWESTDGGSSWRLRRGVPQQNGATDLEIDPLNPDVLYASFWGKNIVKSTDGGRHWRAIMNGLPAADYAEAPTRFSISVSHPDASAPATLYAGFQIGDEDAHVYKSVDAGASWAQTSDGTGDDTVAAYCGGQCWYDNVIEADPTNPDVVYAAGQFDYNIGSGGIYRSDDGGQTWKNLGWDQHPDFHAFAFDPNDADHVLSGSDGGVWESADRGGRTNPGDPIDAVTWQSLNTGGLSIGQFTSIANNPAWTEESGQPFPSRIWGGTQDNGTLRHATDPANPLWTDLSSGDGGQVLVDPTDSNFVYGTYYGISPYRFDNGGAFLFSNQSITRGINLGDRSDFYLPWVLNKDNPDQLFLGTQRAYRTDNAKAPSAGDVQWTPISPDLTSGCTGTAPNGARTCALSAFGVGGGNGVYAGSLDGYLWNSPDAQTEDSPSWKRLRSPLLPNRPVQSIAVDRSNDRIAYVAYGGYDEATPRTHGHVFATTDAGRHWRNVTGNLPNVPINSLVLDPSYAGTLYAGTDVGPYASYDNGRTWTYMGGTSHAIVGIWQLDLDPRHGTLLSGTHGRGAYGMVDATARPALQLDVQDAGIPVGPGSELTYDLTVRNLGTGDATGVTVSDPLPARTSFVSATDGGAARRGRVTWSGLTVPAGGEVTVSLTVRIDSRLPRFVQAITNDGIRVESAEGPFTTGSAFVTPIADPYAVSVTPAAQTDGGRVGTTVSYPLTVTNDGYQSDSYALSSSGGGWPVAFYEADCSTPLTTTAAVAPGASACLCVGVDVPAGAADGDQNAATVTATSVGDPAISASATLDTIAVAVGTLVVDEDGNGPDVQSYYTDAVSAAGQQYAVWDLGVDPNLPTQYLDAFDHVVWFTGNAYPGPLLPYETQLTGYLDGGGQLFVSGQDILDQAAGQTAFVRDYLHVDWDGTEAQNDIVTTSVTGVTGSLTDGVGTVPLDLSVLGAGYMDQVTPIAPATPIFTDSTSEPNALSVDTGGYQVVFLAFPFEEYGTAAQKGDLMSRVFAAFGP